MVEPRNCGIIPGDWVLLAPWNSLKEALNPQEWVWITEVKLTKYNDFSNDTLNIQILMLV